MSRRGKSEDLYGGAAKAWLFLWAKPDGTFVPRAASVATTEKEAERDMLLFGRGSPEPLFMVRADASALVDYCPEFPVYCGIKESE